jgi:predicted dehydrogenase
MIQAGKSTAGAAGRRLRYGMVGGGEGSFIGAVHRAALRLDNIAELAAGCFSRSFEKTAAAGSLLGVERDRLYENSRQMAERESSRPDPIDFVVIVTPNSTHYETAKNFLEHGIHVVCDKPLTITSSEAVELVALAEERGLQFGVTYTYSGYPAVRQIRELIRRGDIGNIRFVSGEYPQDWLAEPAERGSGNAQAQWRTDPSTSGISNCVGDIGTHLEHMISYVTGLTIRSLCARLDTMVEGRRLDDNASVMLEYAGGAKGLYWCSQIAWGHDNGLSFRIYGTKGSVSWSQETPDRYELAVTGETKRTVIRGRDRFFPGAETLVRIPAGHPEGYYEAFANIYRSYCTALLDRKSGITPSAECEYPTAVDGLNGVRFVEACVESSRGGAVWVELGQR